MGSEQEPTTSREAPEGAGVPVCARVLLLHTGGSLWVDVIGMQGARVEPLVQWLPTSGRAELGLVPAALSTLSCFRAASRLSHLVVGLSPGDVPAGDSGQLAVALAAVWYWTASQRRLPCARPHGPAARTERILAATGVIDGQPSGDGLYRYAVGPVDGLDEKVAALAARRHEARCLELLVPATQRAAAAESVARHFPDAAPSARGGTWLLPDGHVRLHAVADLDDLEDAVDLVVADTAPPGVADLDVGVTLEGRFTLRALVGEGGAARVWRAHDAVTGEDVAVKVLHPHLARDPERLAAFFRGARHMARLGGAGIARVVHPLGADGPHRYLALQLLPRSLHDAVRAGPVPLDVVLRAADTLGAAHAQGVVHRDVKPHNVMLDAAGAPVLVDFDLARAQGAGTTTTRSLGSLAFCAPEVLADGADAATPRSDVYSLAMTALFVLHGGDLPVAALRAPHDFLGGVDAPSAVRWALASALATDPADRPRDGHAFARSLRDAVARGDGGPAYVGPTDRGLARARAWTPRLVVLAAIGLVLALGGLVAWRSAARETSAVRADAERQAMAERAWRVAGERPGEALALLRAADRLDASAAAALLGSGAAWRGWDLSSKVLSADVVGGVLAAGTLDGHVVGLELATGRQLWRVHTGLDRVKRLIATPSGGIVAWASDAVLRGDHDDHAHLLDARTGARVVGPDISGSPIDVAFSRDLALSVDERRLVFWDLSTGLPLREHPLGAGVGAHVSPDGQTALLTSDAGDRRVRVDAVSDRSRAAAVPPGRFAWSGDGARYGKGSTGRLVVYDTDRLLPVGEVDVACHERLFLDRTGRHAVCGGVGTEVALVDVDDGTVVPLPGHGARLSVAAFVGPAALTGGFDGSLRVWDVRTGAPVATLAGHAALIEAIVPIDDHTIATASHDGTVRVWDLSRLLHARRLVARDVRGAVAVRGDRIAWRDAGGRLWIDDHAVGSIAADDALSWSGDGVVSAGRECARWTADGARTALAFPCRKLATVEVGDVVRVGAVGHDERVWLGTLGGALEVTPRTTSTVIQGVVWAGTESLLVFPYQGTAMVLDPAGRPVVRLEGLDAGVTDHVIRGDRLVAGTWSDDAGAWDVGTGARLATFRGHTEEVVAVDVSPDGARAATGSWDDTARIWDLATGAPWVTLAPGAGDVIDVAFSPDGSRLATLTADRRIRLYDVASGALLADQTGSRARFVTWDAPGLLTLELDGTLGWWEPAPGPPDGWDATAGRSANLRVCPGTREVVLVTPWPDPASVLAPDAACAVRASDPGAAR